MEADFGHKLIKWYLINKRELPWRNISDPYKIWLSEVILQQTRVEQGLPYYEAFITKYPSVSKLAKASEDQVLKLWQGLGYYSRARNMLKAAQVVESVYKGKFPSDYEKVRQLPGVGDYTAAAVCSFAFNLPYAVVDGNVFRLLARYFGINTPINSAMGKKTFSILAQNLLVNKTPGLYNQAIMEFGSQVCKPHKPYCVDCVLKESCVAFRKNLINKLPVKIKKQKVRVRYFNYFLLENSKGQVYVNRRKAGDIWEGLYEFFLLETPEEMNIKTLRKNKELRKFFDSKTLIQEKEEVFTHQLSHQKIIARFYRVRKAKFSKNEQSIPIKEINKLAWPRLIHRYLESCFLETE